MNCIARYAGEHCDDPGFRTIEEHDFKTFKQYDRQDLENCMLSGLHRVVHMPKAERELRERVLGFKFDLDSIWACPVNRALVHVDMIQNDALHCYWSNGICNSEIVILLGRVRKEVGITLPALQDMCLASEWRRQKKNGRQAFCSPFVQGMFVRGIWLQGQCRRHSRSVRLAALGGWITLAECSHITCLRHVLPAALPRDRLAPW